MPTVKARRWTTFGIGLLTGLCVLAGGTAFAQPAAPPKADLAQPDHRYIRTVDDEDNNRVVMQAAARTFVHRDKSGKQVGPAVTMCAAVHIADDAFYKNLQSLLDAKDVVLFEAVKPAGMGRPEHDLPGIDPDERRADTTRTRIRMLGIAARSQKLRAGVYPSSIADMLEGLSPKLRPYLASVVKDAWGRDLEYVRTVEGGAGQGSTGAEEQGSPDAAPAKKPAVRDSIEITSLGADGVPGGDDANEDLRLSDQRPIRPAEVPRGDAKGIQSELADALGLVFQLDAMTHDHANWRNSDLSVDQVQERLSGGPRASKSDDIVETERGSTRAGEHGSTTAQASKVAGKKRAGGKDDAEALFKMLDGSSLQAGVIRVVLGIVKWIPGMQEMGKVAMMEMLGRADDLLTTVPGMERMLDVIIKDRNQVVIDDLTRIIETEPSIKSVGIIYGGGHMPDLEKRLADMGYTESSVQWLDAIAMDLPADAAGKKQMQRIRAMVQSSLDQQIDAARRKAKKPAE